MDQRDGCLAGLLKLLVLDWVFDALQDQFGVGKGCSCTGCGCGCILWVIFVFMACGIIANTDWTRIGTLILGMGA